jgi:predicted TIM-barrel fold metal-dependent hydrolase
MADLGFLAFDADHHYYEAEDAFIRHVPRDLRKRCMQWAVVDGKKRLLVGGRINRFIPNPTFDPVAKPGILDQYFRGRNPEAKDVRTLFGELEPISAAYRDRDAKLALLDQQRIEGCFLFPTLGVGMEQSLRHDPEALLAAFRGFNRWLEEDWGFAYRGRIFAAPYITLVDVGFAVEELEYALARGARVLVMRAAPVADPTGSRSLGDRRYDPFWARVNEAGVTLAFHSGDAGYLQYAKDWGCGEEFESFRYETLRLCLSANPIRDAMAALVCDGVFERHPKLRIATIESGSDWVAGLLKVFKKAYGQMPRAFASDPIEQFKAHVWVSPYYEDDLERLRNTIGADRVLFGSDYPHAEGLAEPTDFVYDLKDWSEDDVRLAMRENGFSLVRPPA